jgi:hypothetical protein
MSAQSASGPAVAAALRCGPTPQYRHRQRSNPGRTRHRVGSRVFGPVRLRRPVAMPDGTFPTACFLMAREPTRIKRAAACSFCGPETIGGRLRHRPFAAATARTAGSRSRLPPIGYLRLVYRRILFTQGYVFFTGCQCGSDLRKQAFSQVRRRSCDGNGTEESVLWTHPGTHPGTHPAVSAGTQRHRRSPRPRTAARRGGPSAGSAARCRCPGPAAAVYGRADRCSRTARGCRVSAP